MNLNSTMKLEIQKFNVESIKPNRMLLLVGRRGTGKSTLMYDLMYRLQKRFDFGCAMTPTLSSAEDFKQYLPSGLVFEDGYDVEQLKRMINVCKELKRRKKRKSSVMLLDDCMADKKLFRGETIRDMALNGRHYDITFVNALQYLMDIGPDLRTQFDYVFVLKESITANKERLHKYFFGMFEKKDDFYKVLDKCTENNECLVLDQTRPTSRISDCVFYYKATPQEYLPKFKLLNPVYWFLDYKFKKNGKEQESSLLKPCFGETNSKPTDKNNPRVEVVVKNPIPIQPENEQNRFSKPEQNYTQYVRPQVAPPTSMYPYQSSYVTQSQTQPTSYSSFVHHPIGVHSLMPKPQDNYYNQIRNSSNYPLMNYQVY